MYVPALCVTDCVPRECVETGARDHALSGDLRASAAMATFSARLRGLWDHPAGPKTIFFWAPTFKWGISIANISDLQRNPDDVSLPMQLAVTATGLIWSKYSLDITPKNYNLLAVNAFMACTGMIQLYRKYDHSQKKGLLEDPGSAPSS